MTLYGVLFIFLLGSATAENQSTVSNANSTEATIGPLAESAQNITPPLDPNNPYGEGSNDGKKIHRVSARRTCLTLDDWDPETQTKINEGKKIKKSKANGMSLKYASFSAFGYNRVVDACVTVDRRKVNAVEPIFMPCPFGSELVGAFCEGRIIGDTKPYCPLGYQINADRICTRTIVYMVNTRPYCPEGFTLKMRAGPEGIASCVHEEIVDPVVVPLDEETGLQEIACPEGAYRLVPGARTADGTDRKRDQKRIDGLPCVRRAVVAALYPEKCVRGYFFSPLNGGSCVRIDAREPEERCPKGEATIVTQNRITLHDTKYHRRELSETPAESNGQPQQSSSALDASYFFDIGVVDQKPIFDADSSTDHIAQCEADRMLAMRPHCPPGYQLEGFEGGRMCYKKVFTPYEWSCDGREGFHLVHSPGTNPWCEFSYESWKWAKGPNYLTRRQRLTSRYVSKDATTLDALDAYDIGISLRSALWGDKQPEHQDAVATALKEASFSPSSESNENISDDTMHYPQRHNEMARASKLQETIGQEKSKRKAERLSRKAKRMGKGVKSEGLHF